ncbi:hypothetical protein BC351_01120 [Paenibacillus ferrarius]|uniref:Uncharacterized protein n=1 Tax=Paenibacillus ferrarius TaxID=1469647 RepID=A0A1V4HSR7_9BACL|nr:hypothetical protein [Paenibacillus ferrarius]OPH61872.1 hypothetical protein BC351_01120 [Paenibacillus ferrarius]
MTQEQEYLFKEGQTVRLLKNLDVNVHAILHLLGQKGVVEQRYRNMMHRTNWYNVRFPSGEIEPFEEDELDSRFKKRKPLKEDEL